jgi:hypothetical protein
MRAPFQHEYGEGIVLVAEATNALVLIVAATMPLARTFPGYDAGKIGKLKAASAAYAHENKITQPPEIAQAAVGRGRRKAGRCRGAGYDCVRRLRLGAVVGKAAVRAERQQRAFDRFRDP